MKKIILITFIISILMINTAFGISIVDVACGDNHTVLLAEDGTVWTMGNNKYGQCGPNNIGENIYIPVQLLNIPKIQKIYADSNATMLLDEDGEAYEVVDGRLVPCGIENVVDISMKYVKKVSVNSTTYTKGNEGMGYALLTEDGDVYVKGYGEEQFKYSAADWIFYHIGLVTKTPVVNWTKINVSNIESVYWKKLLIKDYVYGYGLVCEDAEGNIWDCSSVGYYSSKTTSIIKKNSDKFTDFQRKYSRWNSVDFVEDSFSLTTGTNRSILKEEILLYLSGDILLKTDGSVYDTYTGSLERNYNIYNKKIVDADCGLNHRILIDEDGNVYGYGDNTYGQLGLRNFVQEKLEVLETAETNIASLGNTASNAKLYWRGWLKRGEIITFKTIALAATTDGEPYDISNILSEFKNRPINTPTLIESLQEIVPNEQSSLAYITSDAKVWIGGVANFSLMFEVNEDMTLRNTGTTLHEIFSNGALNIKVYDKNGIHLPQAVGYVYNVYEDGKDITTTITPNFVFKSAKTYQLICGIGNVFDVRGDTYTVRFEGMNASKVKDGVVTQMRSSVNIAKFILKVYVTELSLLT